VHAKLDLIAQVGMLSCDRGGDDTPDEYPGDLADMLHPGSVVFVKQGAASISGSARCGGLS
jgi:hypothetical protein